MTLKLQRHVEVPFRKYIKPLFEGKPCRYLEIGAFAGGTARFMLEEVLTHPDSCAHLVDPWEGYQAEDRPDGNPRIYTEDVL